MCKSVIVVVCCLFFLLSASGFSHNLFVPEKPDPDFVAKLT